MSHQNSITIEGNLVSDPDVISGEKGDMARFRIASNSRYKDRDDVTYVDIKVFRNVMNDLNYFDPKKGSRVVVDGRFVIEEWEKDDQKFRSPVIYANRITRVHTPPKKSDSDF